MPPSQAPGGSSSGPLKLNLGCGLKRLPGYVNVDKEGAPDVKWDLETLPWPWETSSVDEVQLVHVLEHLGRDQNVFFAIIRELYRICQDGATVHITVPHPRHDNFLADPTHVRPFLPQSFHMYSKQANRQWAEAGLANTPLAMHLDVNFVVESLEMDLEQPWGSELASGKLTKQQIAQYARLYNNVVQQIRVRWRVQKPAAR